MYIAYISSFDLASIQLLVVKQMRPLLLSHKLHQLGLRMDKVRVEATSMAKVNLGRTPTFKLISTF